MGGKWDEISTTQSFSQFHHFLVVNLQLDTLNLIFPSIKLASRIIMRMKSDDLCKINSQHSGWYMRRIPRMLIIMNREKIFWDCRVLVQLGKNVKRWHS